MFNRIKGKKKNISTIVYTASAKVKPNSGYENIGGAKYNDELSTYNPETTIGKMVFNGTLTEIPNSYTTSQGFIRGNVNILTIESLPNTITFIGRNAFRECKKLQYVNLPNNLEIIGHRVFQECHKLKQLNIPDKVYQIGEYVCNGCYELKIVNIGKSVKTFVKNDTTHPTENASGLFTSAPLNTVYWNAIKCNNFSDSARAPFTPESMAPSGDVKIPNIIIGENVTHIPSRLCYQNTGLTTITIPKSVTSIGDKVFFDCINLQEVYFEGNTPPTMGKNTFVYSINGTTSNLDVLPNLVIYVPEDYYNTYIEAYPEYSNNIQTF